ncbi:MAG: rod shape-determining protein, partial [Lentisphaeria bacterium]|nr:rod shape-determining protein [Lentisphaeria bacterium]
MSITAERLNAVIEKIKTIRIAVLGDLMLDRYVSGTASRLSQEAPVPVLHVRKSDVRLGGAANVMRNLTSLGVKHVLAFGIVGQDRDGEELCALLQKGGVNTEGVFAVSDRRTTVKQRVIAGSQQVVRMDFEDTEPVSEEVRNAMADPISQIIDTIRTTLEKTPPELSADIIDRGITLMGGGALLRGLAELIAEETGMPVTVAANPLDCVV